MTSLPPLSFPIYTKSPEMQLPQGVASRGWNGSLRRMKRVKREIALARTVDAGMMVPIQRAFSTSTPWAGMLNPQFAPGLYRIL